MKRFAPIFASALCLLVSAGCHGQAPTPTPGYNVNLSWSAAASDGNSAPYSYAVFAESVSSGGSCDPTTSTNWKEVTTVATRPTATAYSDANATGLTRCYFVVTYQTISGNPANSGPSNVAQVVVPGVPTPAVLAAPVTQQAENVVPVLKPNGREAGQLVAKLEKR